ncbi:3-hydroxyacyl-CoA dehydrogenase [Streptomyces sp. SID3343]|uniref:3-hydroxyacyl-CoA dehydrogenase family protein n=1 Tax=Streptomyces sp. SID3343 TaxID=2690260 RepID=UPI00136F6A01|nr:3-hydroxyacyl-CoA dehydrogenase [Streptomyces sp. SID3343]MYW04020.1 3-hydroxyacyl-CoA dehydrogenase family protein [Streptomyces sp. SID3343]
MTRDISTVGVVGLGTMGAGIVEVLARAGVTVVAVDVSDDAIARGRARIAESTARAVARGKLTDEQQREIFDRITLGTDLASVADADLVLEAIPEHLEQKQELFARLDKICGPETILATNTSSLSVTELSVSTSRSARVVGLHFFNPAPVMKLVEVVRTVVTEPDVLADVVALAERLGKSPVVAGDRAGFIANGLLFAYLNHAASMYEQKYATREDIDAAMRFGCGLPMGPLAVLDLVGIDTAYEILDQMYRQSRDRLHAPAPILKQMRTAGLLGRKSGRGFYHYEQPGSPVVVAEAAGAAPVAGTPRDVRAVGVVGTGTMATGIVEVFAKSGFDVVYVARSEEKVERVRTGLLRSLERQVQRGRLTEEARDAALARVSGTTRLDDLAFADLVVEAVVEELSVKQALFENFDEICKPGAILATTTSSLPVIDCAVATSRPGDVVGMHFFNPAPVMKLVEVVRTVATTDDVVATIHAVCAKTRKHAVDCGDRAGFIVNALLFPYLNDAVRMLAANYASADDIDTAIKLGAGYPMGPFDLLDVVGLDVSLAIQKVLFAEFREPGWSPVPLLEHLVTAGYLGRKTGRGFRDHAKK